MYHFIINPKSQSGKGRKIWEIIKQELDNRKLTYEYTITRYPHHATEITRDLCHNLSGILKLIVVGGDGTVNEVINGIMNFNQVLLGYIPSGSSNDLGRSLRLPKDPLLNLATILKPSRFRYIDIGQLKTAEGYERKFIVSSGIGFDAAICEETFHSGIKRFLNKYGLGKLTYIIIALKQLLTCPFMTAEISIDNGPVTKYKQVLMITSMNHKYEGGGMMIAPAANPFDGKLSVCLVHDIPKLKTLLLMPTILFGKHTRFHGIETFDCKSLDIKLQRPAYLHSDGECPGAFKHVSLNCVSNTLRIMI
jgi:YegS/Rv2252/BmrU family lipid kinase